MPKNETETESSRRWIFTLNNYSEEEEVILQELPCVYMVYGREKGENGTPHLQGFVTFNGMKRLSGMKKINKRAHWEPAKSISRINREYCLKGSQPKPEWDELNTSGPSYGLDVDSFERGKCPNQGQRSDIESACDRIDAGTSMRDVAKEFPATFVHNYRGLTAYQLITTLNPYHSETTRGIWIWGKTGLGKSSQVWKQYGDSLFDKPQNKWWDGYAGEETVLLDDFDKKGVCLSHYLKRWTDHYPCTGETKGGTVHLRHKRFIITCQYSIETIFGKPDENGETDNELIEALKRRFRVTHISTPFAKKKRARSDSS
jgi:hypothetical protein